MKKKSLTSTEDAELLSGGYDVEVCGEEVHKCTGIHHKHKDAETVYSDLLPAEVRKILHVKIGPKEKKTTIKSLKSSYYE